MGTCSSKNFVRVRLNTTEFSIHVEDIKKIKFMGQFLNKIGISRNEWTLLETLDGAPLFDYSIFRYQTVIITMTNGRKKRLEITPMYRKKTKSRR